MPSLLALVLLAGCSPSLSPQGREALVNAYASYDRGDDAQTIQTTTYFLQQHGKEPRTDEALLLRGMARYRSGDLPAAGADLQAAAQRAASPKTRATAYYNLGNAAYDGGQMQPAADAFAAAIDSAGAQGEMATLRGNSHYRLGTALQRLGRWEEADENLHRAAHLLPGTDIATQAARRVNCRAWSVQAGAFTAKSGADALVGKLRQNRLPADVMPDRSPKPRYIVHVGRFATFEQAEAMLAQVKRLQSDAFVIATE